jgi:ParB family chromosome partitioning protein
MTKILQIETRHPDEIIIINRARQDAGDINSLADNIKAVGQLNPILINSQNILIAGERRLLAMKHLKRKRVDVRVVDGVQPDDQLMIELLENLHRKDFTWHEDIDLKYKLHTFWSGKAKEEGKEWGYRDTAKKLRCSLGGLSTDLALAEAMKVFPELRDQTSKARAREVYKAYGNQAQALQRMNSLSDVEQENLQKLQAGIIELPIKNTVPKHVKENVKQKAAEVTEQLEAVESEKEDAAPLNMRVIYVSENYKKFIQKIPDASVGMIELDPPYAIGYDKNYGEETNKLRSSDDWTEKDLYEFYCDYLPILYQKLTASAWILCWTGKEHFLRINELAAKAGFVTQEPGVWTKTGGSSHIPKRKMISNWEMYLLFRKGDATFNTASLPSAVAVPTVPASQRIHRWEKPMDLYDHFLKALCQPGTIFLSLFAGSGNSLISAAKAGMMPIGCDKSAKYIPQFYSRVQNYLGITPDVEGL